MIIDDATPTGGPGQGDVGTAIRVLLVDDEPEILRYYGAALRRRGWIVETADDGKTAIARVNDGAFDVIVSDIHMPHSSGIEFLKAVRAHDLDVPVILMTGDPSIESAIEAIEYGVFSYLTKPIAGQLLTSTVERAARLHEMARLKLKALALSGGGGRRLGERAALEARFSWGMELMWMAFQPIVRWGDRRLIAYEALLRSDEPLMKNPADMLEAAERLGRVHQLGRAVRAHVAAGASAAPTDVSFFVNLHSADLGDPELYEAGSPLSKLAPRVVLEVTERASLSGLKDLPSCVARLKAMGFRIAIDDLGAGYAGLSSFTQLEPQIAKIDMSLVRDIDTDARRRSIVHAMTDLCHDLGIVVVAEGVETEAERDVLADLGCDSLQGYLFGRPERGFKEPKW